MTWTQDELPESLSDLLTQEEFSSSEILHNAFIHRSYLNEHLDFNKLSNERLEFLGDAVLQFLTSQFLIRPRESLQNQLKERLQSEGFRLARLQTHHIETFMSQMLSLL